MRYGTICGGKINLTPSERIIRHRDSDERANIQAVENTFEQVYRFANFLELGIRKCEEDKRSEIIKGAKQIQWEKSQSFEYMGSVN